MKNIKLYEGFIADLQSETDSIKDVHISKMNTEVESHIEKRVQVILPDVQGLVDEFELISKPRVQRTFIQFNFSHTVIIDAKLLSELIRVNKKLSEFGMDMFIGRNAEELLSLSIIENRYKKFKKDIKIDYLVFKEAM